MTLTGDTTMTKTPKYKLDMQRDVDIVPQYPGQTYIVNLPPGWKFLHDYWTPEHVRGFDTMRELRQDVRSNVGPCDCEECQAYLQGKPSPWQPPQYVPKG